MSTKKKTTSNVTTPTSGGRTSVTKGAFGKPPEETIGPDTLIGKRHEETKPAFKPLTLGAQRTVPKLADGTKVVLREDVMVMEGAELNLEGGPRLLMKRVGKRKLNDAERQSVLPKGTVLEFKGRTVVRTRIGESKGERVTVEVKADVFRYLSIADGLDVLIVGDRALVETKNDVKAAKDGE